MVTTKTPDSTSSSLLALSPSLAHTFRPCSPSYSCAHLPSHFSSYGDPKETFKYLQIRKVRGHTPGGRTGTSFTWREKEREEGGCSEVARGPSSPHYPAVGRGLFWPAENKEKVLVSCGIRRQRLKQVPPLKATRQKVKYSPFRLSGTEIYEMSELR